MRTKGDIAPRDDVKKGMAQQSHEMPHGSQNLYCTKPLCGRERVARASIGHSLRVRGRLGAGAPRWWRVGFVDRGGGAGEDEPANSIYIPRCFLSFFTRCF